MVVRLIWQNKFCKTAIGLVLLFLVKSGFAQDFWTQTNGPFGGSVRSMSMDELEFEGDMYVIEMDEFEDFDFGDFDTEMDF